MLRLCVLLTLHASDLAAELDQLWRPLPVMLMPCKYLSNLDRSKEPLTLRLAACGHCPLAVLSPVLGAMAKLLIIFCL